jgi:5-methylcytosine-specific restriction enzyme A
LVLLAERSLSRVRGVSEERLAAYRKGACRWCDGSVAPPRRTFCSEACVHQWKLRSNPHYRRQHVFKRDGGICAQCRRDCHVLQRDLNLLLYANPSRYEAEVERLQLGKGFRLGKSLWEADHVVAVFDGGGSCDLYNLQTLCFLCHRKKTAELAARRAAKRREIRPPDEDMFASSPVPWELFEDES